MGATTPLTTITHVQYAEALRDAKVEALRELVRVCFDEGDAGVTVGGIETVECYIFDTIAELTGAEADVTNAETMRRVAAESYARKAGR